MNDKVTYPDRSSALAVGRAAEGGQATQGTGWMPWRQEPMKDVASDDIPWGAAAGADPGVSEWGNPAEAMLGHSRLNQIGLVEVSQRTETSQ